MNYNSMPQASAEVDRQSIKRRKKGDFNDEKKGFSGNMLMVIAAIAAIFLLISYYSFAKYEEVLVESGSTIDPQETRIIDLDENSQKQYKRQMFFKLTGNLMLPLFLFVLCRRSLGEWQADKAFKSEKILVKKIYKIPVELRDCLFLLLTALLAEPAFNIFRYRVTSYKSVQNPLFTLALAAFFLYINNKIEFKGIPAVIAKIALFTCTLIAAALLRLEDGLMAVGMIGVFRYIYDHAIAQAAGCALLSLHQLSTPVAGLAILQYDKRSCEDIYIMIAPLLYTLGVWILYFIARFTR